MARQQVPRAGRLTVIVGLLSATVPEFGPLVVTASRQQQTSNDKIAIVRDVQSAGVLDPTAWLSRPFQTAGPCASRRAGTTALQLLRPDVRTVAIQWYDTQAWSELPRAAAYVRRILDAVPEGGALQEHIYWSEDRPVEIAGVLIFSEGPPRQIALGNGYLHFEDQSGCQWWGRYLGPNRDSWVVRK